MNTIISNIESSWEPFLTKFCEINVNKVNKTLSNIKSFWEQFLTKFLFDQCEQSEQNPFKISKAFGF